MGSSESYVGPNGFPSEYRHTEMYGNYEGLRTRIVTGSRDFIRWYHRRMNAMWHYVRPFHEQEEFDAEHGTPGMAKTLGFHMKAFREPCLFPGSGITPMFIRRSTSGDILCKRTGRHPASRCSKTYNGLVSVRASASGCPMAVFCLPSPFALHRPRLRSRQGVSRHRCESVERRSQAQSNEERFPGPVALPAGRRRSRNRHQRRRGADSHARRVANCQRAPGNGRPVSSPQTVALEQGRRCGAHVRVSVKSPAPGVTVRTPRISLPRLAAGESAEVPEELLVELDDEPAVKCCAC